MQFVLRSATPPPLQFGRGARCPSPCDPSAGVEGRPLYSSIGLAFLPSQVGAVLLGAIGVLGLTLAAVGLYGMMAYSVARRIQEIGVRLAFGATERDIARMVLTSRRGSSARLADRPCNGGTGDATACDVPRRRIVARRSSLARRCRRRVESRRGGGVLGTGSPRISVDPIAALRYE